MKKMINGAVLAALITTGAYAFDTNKDGEILNFSGQKATFTEALTDEPNVLRVGDIKGDALIVQAFNQKDGFGTEIVVRNNNDVGVVVKIALHEHNQSKEVLDFNGYLSANDVLRFTIQDGKITSTDDSMLHTGGSEPVFGLPDAPVVYDFPTESGYAVIFAMAQTSNTEHGEDAKQALIKEYRNGLDAYRPNWDNYANMQEGVYVNETTDNKGNPTSVTVSPYLLVDGKNGIDLRSPAKDVISATTRIFNSEDVERDMIINAQAFTNFTENGKIMLWSPGEVASAADRNIMLLEEEAGIDTDRDEKVAVLCVEDTKCPHPTPTPEPTDDPGIQEFTGVVLYNLVTLESDASKLIKRKAFYTYTNEGGNYDVDNKLIITQPYKRLLIQSGNTAYWSNMTCADREGEGQAFRTYRRVWDESENNTEASTTMPETSPGNSTDILGYCNELATIVSPEKETEFAEKNGYIAYQFGVNGVPAVVTQMKATQVGETYKINWIKSVTGDK